MVVAGSDASATVAALLTAAGDAIGASRLAVVSSGPAGEAALVGGIWEDGALRTALAEVDLASPDLHSELGWNHGTTVAVTVPPVSRLAADGAWLDVDAARAIGPLLAIALRHAAELDELSAARVRSRQHAAAGTDLVSVVSHELRTPLTSILGALQTLQRLGLTPPGSDAARIVDSASRRADRLHALVDDLLVAVRPDRAARSRSVRSVGLGSLVDDAVATVPGAADHTLVEIRPTDATVAVDPDRVGRILVNILDNATRHGAGTIEVTAVREPDTLRLQVADHGPGLPEAAAAALTGSDPTSLQPIGTGLGLAITRGLVAALDGTITARATPGGGATLEVLLPLTPGEPTPPVV